MAKDPKPADQMDAFSSRLWRRRMKLWRSILIFFKKSVSSFPSGGTELGEKLKDQSVQNIIAVRKLVKKLSQAKDFEEAFRIPTEFMQSQLHAFGEQIKVLARRIPKKPQVGSRCHSKVCLIRAFV